MSHHDSRYLDILEQPVHDPDQLHNWIRLFTHLNIPREPVCPHHCAPFDYISHAYFEPAEDAIVWAPRGGGKTRLAALATLLDLLHKPGCSVRILGGSIQQSLRMWEHLFPDLTRIAEELLESKAGTSKRLKLTNGSEAAVLTQSQRAVRGLRVQKLRCDEVEMFKPEIWEAAQLVTRSKTRAPAHWTSPAHQAGALISGAIEAISTFHHPWGLMSRIIDAAPARKIPVFRWCILEVLEKCPPERECASCPLWSECQGVAKTRCDGFVRIDDAIAMKRRVSKETWESEMLCQRPSVQGSVFPTFDPMKHVRQEVGIRGQGSGIREEDLAPQNSLSPDPRSLTPLTCELSLAVDFGFAAPFVCLWVRTFCDDTTHVVDEYVQPGVQIKDHIERIHSRNHGPIARLACDPAGAGRSDQTAASNVAILRQHGFVVRYRKSQIVEGLDLIRASLAPALGEPRLFVHPRCTRLIKAMQAYHYPPGGAELPVKDGVHDHLIDALRYHFVNKPVVVEGPPRRY